MSIQASGEDYIEAIYLLRRSMGCVHAADVARRLGFSRASVSIALKQLEGEGYAYRDEAGHIQLTAAGDAMAEQVYGRHDLLAGFLRSIGVSDAVAQRDACQLEHHLSQESYERLSEYCAGAKKDPRG